MWIDIKKDIEDDIEGILNDIDNVKFINNIKLF